MSTIPTLSQIHDYAIASTCLEGILVVPLGLIWLVSFFTVRHRRDPARRPFTWMKAAYPFIILSLVFNVVAYIVYIVIYYNYYDDDGNYLTLEQIQDRIADVGNLIESFGQVFLLFCLVELGLSFLYVLNRSQTGHNIIRGVVAGLGVVLLALALAYFGKQETLYTDYYNAADNNSTVYFFEPYSSIELGVSFDFILWIASIAVVAFTVYTLVVSHQNPQTRGNAIIYLVIGILYLLRNTWIISYDAMYLLPKIPPSDPLYVEVLWSILDSWVTFVVLVLVFAIGCRKRRGLWTTEQASTRIFPNGQQPQPIQQQWQSPHHVVVPQGVPMQYTQQVLNPQVQK